MRGLGWGAAWSDGEAARKATPCTATAEAPSRDGPGVPAPALQLRGHRLARTAWHAPPGTHRLADRVPQWGLRTGLFLTRSSVSHVHILLGFFLPKSNVILSEKVGHSDLKDTDRSKRWPSPGMLRGQAGLGRGRGARSLARPSGGARAAKTALAPGSSAAPGNLGAPGPCPEGGLCFCTPTNLTLAPPSLIRSVLGCSLLPPGSKVAVMVRGGGLCPETKSDFFQRRL